MGGRRRRKRRIMTMKSMIMGMRRKKVRGVMRKRMK